MNWKIGVGIVLQSLNIWGELASDSQFMQVAGYVGIACLLANLAGCWLIASGERRRGAFLVIAGSMLFVPLGLLAIFGARQVLDEDNERQFYQGA
jgi:hypothetical protein